MRGALSCPPVTNHGSQTTTEASISPNLNYSLPYPSLLGLSTIGLAAFFGFSGFCLAISGPVSMMTILHLSALAVFCLMLAGLCRWFSKRPFKASTDERFRCLFEYAAVAMSIVDSDRRFVHVNRAYSELLGYDTSELLGSPLTMVTHPEDISEHLVWWDEMFRRNERSSAQDKRYIRKDGHVNWELS